MAQIIVAAGRLAKGRRRATPPVTCARTAPTRAAHAMPTISADPLSRFLAIAKALTDEKSWWEDRSIMRYAALPLVTTAGDAKALAQQTVAAGRALAADARWGSDLRTSLRNVLAAFVVAQGGDPAAFAGACARLRERFRKAGVRRGGGHELVAAAMLHVCGAENDADVHRMQQIYETMKQHHWWLTGPEDLPACALLAVHADNVAKMPKRIEAIYERLREGGLAAGDGLQMASHVLYLARGDERTIADRFLRLHQGFKDRGIRMWDCDRDELAILCLLDEDPALTTATVEKHRERIRQELKHVGPTTGFSYACGTAFLTALAGKPPGAALLRDLTISNLAMATNAASLLAQQNAAAAASAAH